MCRCHQRGSWEKPATNCTGIVDYESSVHKTMFVTFVWEKIFCVLVNEKNEWKTETWVPPIRGFLGSTHHLFWASRYAICERFIKALYEWLKFFRPIPNVMGEEGRWGKIYGDCDYRLRGEKGWCIKDVARERCNNVALSLGGNGVEERKNYYWTRLWNSNAFERDVLEYYFEKSSSACVAVHSSTEETVRYIRVILKIK